VFSDFNTWANGLSGKQHYWPLTETSGTSAADTGGTPLTLTWGADVSGFLTTGPDSAAQVPVNNGSATKVAINSTGFAPSATATYFWWQRQDVDATDDGMIFELSNSPTFTHVVQSDYNNSAGSGPGAGKALSNINYGNATASGQAVITKATTGQWNFYCLVIDVSLALGSQVKVYKNGTLVSTDITGAGGSQAALTPATLKVGILGRNNNGTRQLPIKAAGCAFGVVNRAITTTEMSAGVAAMLLPIPVATSRSLLWSVSGVTVTRTVSQSQTLAIAGGTVGTSSAHRAFPSICKQADGKLRMVYRRATAHGTQDGALCTITSSDAGATWSGETVILGGGAGTLGGQRNAIQDTHIRKLTSGRLAIAFCQWATGTLVGFPTGNLWRGWYIYSDDNGSTWSTPVEVTFTGGSAPLFGFGTFLDGFIELADGSLLATCYALNSFGTAWDIHVAKSTNGGTTWAYLSHLTGTIGGFNTVETSMAQLANGDAYATFHTEDGTPTDVWQAISTDGGATWGTPRQMLVSESNNRTFCMLTNEGDLLQSYYNPTSGNAGIRELWTGGGYGAFGGLLGGAPPDHPTWSGDSLWVNCCQVGASGASPNIGVALGWEAVTQDQANVYYASLTTSLTAVSTSRSLPWTVTAAVSTARALPWAITTTTPVSTSRTLPWKVTSAVATARTMPWAVSASVGAVSTARTLPWTVAGNVSTARSVRWTVIATVSASRQLRWTVDGLSSGRPVVPTLATGTLRRTHVTPFTIRTTEVTDG
jgi:hypothetical protein